MDNPYSPYVDRSGASISWGANPTRKQGPQTFPPIQSFKPYASSSASPGISNNVAAMVERLRSAPASGASAGTSSGASGRGAAAPNTVGGIQGIQGIPTLGDVSGNLSGTPPPSSGDTSISPDSLDQPAPTDTTSPPSGTVVNNPIISRLRGPQPSKRGPQY